MYASRTYIILFCLSLPAAALADVRLEQTMTIEARGLISVFDTEETLFTEISGEHARIETWAGSPAQRRNDAAIVRLDAYSHLELHPEDQLYTTLGLGEKRMRDEQDIESIAQMPQGGPDALPISENNCQWGKLKVNIDRTGQKKKIAGLKAQQYLITAAQICEVPDTRQACDVTWVLDYWNARRVPGSREFSDFRHEYSDAIGTPEMLAMAPVVQRGLLALFEQGWEELAYEAEGLRGYPVRTVMSLHIGGKQCRNRSDQEITRDTVWSRVKQDSIQATKNSAAQTAGQIVGSQVLQKAGGTFGGMIASGAANIFTRNAASRAMEREDEEPAPVTVADESAAERIEGQVQIFRITTELKSARDDDLPRDHFEVPPDWNAAPGA